MPCNAFPISRIQMLPFLFELHSDITIVIRGGFILIWSLCWLFALSKWIGRVETYEGCIRWCSAVTMADVITVGMQCLSRRVQNNECGTKSYTRKKKKKGSEHTLCYHNQDHMSFVIQLSWHYHIMDDSEVQCGGAENIPSKTIIERWKTKIWQGSHSRSIPGSMLQFVKRTALALKRYWKKKAQQRLFIPKRLKQAKSPRNYFYRSAAEQIFPSFLEPSWYWG